MTYSKYSKKTAVYAVVFMGYLGLHYFYVGRIGRGLLAMATLNFFLFGWFADMSEVINGRFKDQYGYYVNSD